MKKFLNAFFTVLLLAISLLLSTSCDEKISEPEVIAVTGVSLSKTSVILTEGDEITLTATVNPDNATNKNVIWKSSDKSVATMSDGKVIALKAGVATITVTTEDANKTAACQVTVVSKVIPVAGVSLDKTSIELIEGDEVTLVAKINPDNATNKNVLWNSSNNNVAIVSDGKVVALKAGTSTITVTTEDGNKTAACEVRVIAEAVPVAGIRLDKNSAEMYVGDQIMLTATVTPENATDKSVIWSSSDTDVATVSEGNVTALSVGYTTITAKSGNSEVKCYITVNPIDVTSISLDKTAVSLLIGESVTLTATVVPENATDKIVTWSSSNNNVATVTNGKITAVSVGNATITAQIGGIKSECSVTVNPIEVTSITLDCTSLTLEVGLTTPLFATVLPENATDKTIIWSSSDTNIVELLEWNNHEYVTAISVGEATITARIGDIKAECVITVKPIEVTGITLNYESAVLSAGESILLNATIFPDDATDKTITWLSSDNSVAIVSDGKVTAMSVGEATITAWIGDVKAECHITVNPTEVVSITLNKASVTLAPDESVTLNARVLLDNATDKTVIWSSSNNGVATVTNGIVTAISVGKATITAKTSNGLYATCLVDVINKPQAGGSEGTGEIEW